MKKYLFTALTLCFIVTTSAFSLTSKEESLFTAIQKNDLSTVNKLIAEKININITDDNGFTPLHTAVQKNNLQIVLAILAVNGVDIEAKLLEEAELTTKNGDTWYASGQTPLLMSAFYGNSEIITALLKKGADILARDSVDGTMAIHIASAQGNTKAVLTILSSDATKKVGIKNIIDASDDTDSTPLMWAAMNEEVGTMTQIIKLGADLNLVDSDGWTALHYAASNNDLKAVELLIKSGADATIRDFEDNLPQDLTDKDTVYQALSKASKIK